GGVDPSGDAQDGNARIVGLGNLHGLSPPNLLPAVRSSSLVGWAFWSAAAGRRFGSGGRGMGGAACPGTGSPKSKGGFNRGGLILDEILLGPAEWGNFFRAGLRPVCRYVYNHRMATLIILQGRNVGAQFPLEQECSVIGRVEGAAIQLLSKAVSRRHA